MRDLGLAGNQLTGTIPTELGNLSNLQQFWLSSNQLTGTIPIELGNLANLQIIHLEDNKLCGEIPASFNATNLPKLTSLVLRNNNLYSSNTNTLLDKLKPDWENQQDKTIPCNILLTPTDFVTTFISQTQINLAWTDNSDNETNFVIDRNGTTITVEENAISKEDNELICGTTYNYSIKAINTDTESATTVITATTQACSIASVVSPLPIPTGGEIHGSLNLNGQTLTEPSTIHTSISNVIFANDVENQGLVSNATILPGATLTGGKLTGTIINKGTITDISFVGAELCGGKLSGTISNDSQVGGIICNLNLVDAILANGELEGYIKADANSIIHNIQLLEKTSIIGGKLSGDIHGKQNAKIGAAEILPGTYIYHVCLTPTVKYNPEEVTFGSGVKLPIGSDKPEDFCIDTRQIPNWDEDSIHKIEPAAFFTFNDKHVTKIPIEIIKFIDTDQLHYFSKDGLSGVKIEQFEQVSLASINGLHSQNMGGLSTEIIGTFNSNHIDMIDNKEFKQMQSDDFSKMLTNFESESVTSKYAEQLIPEDWQFDMETGALTPPPNAKLTLRALPKPENLPKLVTLSKNNIDLHKGMGLAGAGEPIIDGLKTAMIMADLSDLAISQDKNGTLKVKSDDGANAYFIPDVNDIKQGNIDAVGGLSIGKGGFYQLTTPRLSHKKLSRLSIASNLSEQSAKVSIAA
ncbi:hypothetical protein QUF74_19650 [Candidatus Halobeggiatoa sp. HSG11]|nr:hypothetical protein [Candidatus Halobeggiatoa sp. HSG11]